jgi:hypothetical protein
VKCKYVFSGEGHMERGLFSTVSKNKLIHLVNNITLKMHHLKKMSAFICINEAAVMIIK